MSNFDLSSVYFYVDEDLDSDDFVLPVIAAGFRVVRHRDVLPKGALDTEWIPLIAQKGWFVFSHNKEISYVPEESELVMSEKLGLFVVRGQSKYEAHKIWADKVVGAKTQIANFVKKNYRPFIASVTGPQGEKERYRVNPLYPKERLWYDGKMEASRQLRAVTPP